MEHQETPAATLIPKHDTENPQDDYRAYYPPTKWGRRVLYLRRMGKYLIPPALLVILGFSMMPSPSYNYAYFNATTILISTTICVAFFWAYFQFILVARISVEDMQDKPSSDLLEEIQETINQGVHLYLSAKFKACGAFICIFSIIVFAWISYTSGDVLWGFLTTISFWSGASTSMSCGYAGIKMAVFSNVRTVVCAEQQQNQGGGWAWSFNTPFRAGLANGFQVSGSMLLSFYSILAAFRVQYSQPTDWYYLTDAMTGYALGTTIVSLFARVVGGIFVKGADIGADMAGKITKKSIGEDDMRNPAAIADYVGDNIGHILGMNLDYFGSLGEAICAVLVLGSSIGVGVVSADINAAWDAMIYPLSVFCMGVIVSLVCSVITTNIRPVTTEKSIETSFKTQIFATTGLLLPVNYIVSEALLPEQFYLQPIVGDQYFSLGPFEAFLAVSCGTIGALLMGLVTEYHTSHAFTPVKEVADACKTGAATNLIYGLSLGYKSTIVPSLLLAFMIFYSYSLCDMYGVGLASVGYLANLATVMAMNTYGPICDNAAGIAEMAKLDATIRQKTRVLNFSGVSFAAIGKGHAIGSASLVSVALLGAFLSRVRLSNMIYISGVNTLDPLFFTFLIIGGMLPFAFSAMVMGSVAATVMDIVSEVKFQFERNPNLCAESHISSFERVKPDYLACVLVATRKSLQEMIAPTLLVVLSPLICGLFFGIIALTGMLIGCILSCIQLSLSMTNAGGAWANSKKFIERATGDDAIKSGSSNVYVASLVGDSVGDPLKDTVGPALNVMMRGMTVISLVFADVFLGVNQGRGVYGA
mmetsp:Transcript_12625/g.18425  ORF Transcript_12625/g.18425 Transcript_12625/m.18425 type:complete len:816 (-) Transcript_12625:381-2828(-)